MLVLVKISEHMIHVLMDVNICYANASPVKAMHLKIQNPDDEFINV